MDFNQILRGQRYPHWLYQKLIDDLLPWHQAQEITYREFHERYTLHNSYWVGIFYGVAYEQAVTLAIQWDAVWLPTTIKESMTVVDEWPYLFILLTEVEQVSTANYAADIKGISKAIATCEFEQLEGKKFLVIDDVYGSQINIIYKGKETFLALEKDENILKF